MVNKKISELAEAVIIADGDALPINVAGNVVKKILYSTIKGAIHATLKTIATSAITALTDKPTPVSTDVFAVQESSGIYKKVTYTNLFNTILAAFTTPAEVNQSNPYSILAVQSGLPAYVFGSSVITTAKTLLPNTFVPNTGDTVTPDLARDMVILNNTGTLANLTIALGASPVSNKLYRVYFRSAVTTIVWTSSQTRIGFPSTIGAGTYANIMYSSGAVAYIYLP